ncbi:hypothetical protein [Promicromonospora aerolata]|uniref:Lipoprotein n=1 Tax=Promicromonospora aerolata TaxID=195749 RepID=A0ABW4V8P7_9MICO
MIDAVPPVLRRVRAAAALGVALALTACTPSDRPRDLDVVFDEEQTTTDVLPDEMLAYLAVDGGTTRRLGADDALTFYAARSNEGAATCLVLVDGAGDGVAGCGTGRNPTGIEVGNGEDAAMLVMPGTDFTDLEQSGWTRLGEFLAVR